MTDILSYDGWLLIYLQVYALFANRHHTFRLYMLSFCWCSQDAYLTWGFAPLLFGRFINTASIQFWHIYFTRKHKNVGFMCECISVIYSHFSGTWYPFSAKCIYPHKERWSNYDSVNCLKNGNIWPIYICTVSEKKSPHSKSL